jgi:hypothetical protein
MEPVCSRPYLQEHAARTYPFKASSQVSGGHILRSFSTFFFVAVDWLKLLLHIRENSG